MRFAVLLAAVITAACFSPARAQLLIASALDRGGHVDKEIVSFLDAPGSHCLNERARQLLGEAQDVREMIGSLVQLLIKERGPEAAKSNEQSFALYDELENLRRMGRRVDHRIDQLEHLPRCPEASGGRYGPRPSTALGPTTAPQVLTSTAPSGATTAGYFVQVNVGNSWSVPTMPEGEHGKGSSAAFNAAIGERWGYHDHWTAGLIRYETYSAQGAFSGALDDLKVRPTAVISAIGQIGPNFPGFATGQVIAPYLETGPSAAYIKVSDAAGSNTKWTGGWTIGAGLDYRVNPWLLFDVNAHWTYLGTKTYQTGPFDVRLNEQVTSVTGGFIFQFDPMTLSDIRLKHDIAQVGRLDNGLGLYRYRYLWSDQIYVGVMAQEVAEVIPDAVVRGPDGYLRVNYARLGLTLETWDEWVTSNEAPTPLARADDVIE